MKKLAWTRSREKVKREKNTEQQTGELLKNRDNNIYEVFQVQSLDIFSCI